MKKRNFCKVFIISLLNFIIFLLSIIFISSIYNIKNHSSYLDNDDVYRNLKCKENSLHNTFNKHYKGEAALFSFVTIGIFVYLLILMVIMKFDIYDNSYLYPNYEINIDSQNNNFNGDGVTNRRLNSHPQTQIIEINDFLDDDKFLRQLLFFSFLFVQIFYILEIIVISAYLSVTNNMKSKENKEKCKKYIEDISTVYKNLIVVGYLFFALFIFFYIYLALLYNKLGEGSQIKLKKCIDSQYCEFLGDCLESFCLCCTNCVKTKTEYEIKIDNENIAREIEGTNEQKDDYIKNLINFKKKLGNLNSTISKGSSIQLSNVYKNIYK